MTDQAFDAPPVPAWDEDGIDAVELDASGRPHPGASSHGEASANSCTPPLDRLRGVGALALQHARIA